MKKFLVGTLIVLLALAALFAGTAYAEESESAPQENDTYVAEIVDGDKCTSVEAAFYAVKEGQTIRLLADSILTESPYISVEKDKVTLDLNSWTLTSKKDTRLFKVSSGKTFTLTDNSDAKTGALIGSGTVNGSGGAILVDEGTFIMYEGTIEGCNVEDTGTFGCGGGIYIYNGGSFKMYGGTIKNCNANNSGGGVSVTDSSSSFTMEGGTIQNCNVNSKGGGVYVRDGGSFTMNGGTIDNCTAKSEWNAGGGVSVTGSSSSFTMTGGTIKNCKATHNNGGGGGVDLTSNASFTLDGGTITGCTAVNGGGGVNLGAGTKFDFKKGTIEKCSSKSGGGISVYISTLTMSGGTIKECNATQSGWEKDKVTGGGGSVCRR